jgi:hypothetical protein
MMSSFPTKILLATDASSEAQLAAATAVDLAKTTTRKQRQRGSVGEEAVPSVAYRLPRSLKENELGPREEAADDPRALRARHLPR